MEGSQTLGYHVQSLKSQLLEAKTIATQRYEQLTAVESQHSRELRECLQSSQDVRTSEEVRHAKAKASLEESLAQASETHELGLNKAKLVYQAQIAEMQEECD